MRFRHAALLAALGTAASSGCVFVGGDVRVNDGHRNRAILTAEAPAPVGPYSQAIRAGDTLYVAGQIGIDPATGQMVPGGVEPETRQALANVRAVLAAAGMGLGDVVQAQVFLADMGDYAAVNAIYAEHFERSPPARAAVQVAALPKGARVEILVTAVRTER